MCRLQVFSTRSNSKWMSSGSFWRSCQCWTWHSSIGNSLKLFVDIRVDDSEKMAHIMLLSQGSGLIHGKDKRSIPCCFEIPKVDKKTIGSSQISTRDVLKYGRTE